MSEVSIPIDEDFFESWVNNADDKDLLNFIGLAAEELYLRSKLGE